MRRDLSRMQGATVVEFAAVTLVLVFMVFALIEMGRLFYTWNSAVDAVHRGARTAAIAEVGDKARVVHDMHIVFPGLKDENVLVEYSADGATWGADCGESLCEYVRVTFENYTFRPLIFFLPASIAMPRFSATSVAEALGDI